MEIPQELKNLDSNSPEVVEATKKRFHEFFNSTKESFLVNGLVDFYVSTGCVKCVDVLVGVREPHDMFFFNKMAESLRNSLGTTRLSVLTLLSHVVMRQPTWLYKIAQHGLFKELLRILKTESAVVNLVSALLTFVTLLPMVPAYVGGALNDIFDIFSRLAAWNTTNPNKLPDDQLVHLQISLHFLFYRLYGMYPCNFLSYLRLQYGARENLAVFSHTIKPMLDTVKMHPLLVTTSKETETTTNRWKTMEHHDVVLECAKLSVHASEESCTPDPTTFRARSESELRRVMEVSGYQELKPSGNVSGDSINLWEDEKLTMKSVPVTPLPVETSSPAPIPLTPIAQAHVGSSSFPHEIGTSPPEAAVEATPETTPVKDPRVYRRVPPPPNPAIVRALNQLGTPKWSTSTTPTNSQPSSPMKKDTSPFRFPEHGYGDVVQRRLHGVMQDRLQAQRSVNGDSPREDEGASQEDQEVLEISQLGELSITSLGAVRDCDSVLQDFHPPLVEDVEHCELESGSPCNSGGLHMPNSRSIINLNTRLRYYSQCAPDLRPRPGILGGSTSYTNGGLSSLVRRAHSCPEIKKERPSFTSTDADLTLDENSELETITASVGTQTQDDLLPLYPYDHMLMGLLPQSSITPTAPVTRPRASPSILLDQYLNLAAGQSTGEEVPRRSVTEIERYGKEQLTLVQLLLQFERHRRDIHAERNRRLLGKSRMNRQLEEHNSALRDQLALLVSEIDSLHSEMDKMKEDRRKYDKSMAEELDMCRDQCQNVEKQNRELKAEKDQLLRELRDKKAEIQAATKKLQQVESMYFSVGQELETTRAQASAGETLKGQVACLQRELLIMGEHKSWSSAQLAKMSMRSTRGQKVLHESYQNQVRSLSGQLDAKMVNCEALRSRIAELESQIGKKDMHINEQKRALKAAKEECQEALQAVETKYKSEVATNRKLECHVMELTSKLEMASRRPRRNVSAAQDVLSLAERGGINSPASLSLSSSDGFSLSSTLMTDSLPPRDLQAVLDAPEANAIPEIPEFDDLPGPSGTEDRM